MIIDKINMIRNEEEDRRIAALAITELSETIDKHENTLNKYQPIGINNRVGCFDKMFILENSTVPNESKPLDLTNKKRVAGVTDDDVNLNLQKSGKKEFVYTNIRDDFLQFDLNPSIDKCLLNSVGKCNLAENVYYSSQPVFTIPGVCPLQLDILHPLHKLPNLITRREDEKLKFIKNVSQSHERLLKSLPSGLDSLSNFYMNQCKRTPRRRKNYFLKDGRGVYKKPSSSSCIKNIRTARIPSGLSSLKDFYRNRSMQTKTELSKNSEESFLPSKITLPLCVENETVPSLGGGQNTKEIKSKTSSKSRRRLFEVNLGDESSIAGSLNSINTASSASQDSTDLIPLKVLEMSLADHNLPGGNDKSGVYDDSPSRARKKKSKKSKKNAPLKLDAGTTASKSDVEYNFLDPDDDGDFILHIIASREDSEMMAKFLPLVKLQGGDIDCKDAFRQTPLHISVETNNSEMTRCLLFAGANPCHPDLRGQTCIHLAVLHNNMSALRLMLEHVDESNFNYNVVDFEGQTALHLATLKGNKEAVNMLINSRSIDINAREGKSGKTSLYLSAEHNKPEILFALLTAGASDKECDYSGYTPYQVATTMQNYDIIMILEKHQKILINKYNE